MKKSILFISCEEAHHICDKKQYGEATGWERFKLNLRSSWCRITKSYSKKNNKLSEILQKAEVDCLKDEERHQLEKQFKQELAKHQ